ncbi:MAG TPA: hypothetical protein VFH78_09860, partial [Candidatus Thermoplasmatota archaeon]|nr:hypothetical protein [Candidatus Thermoplasmatota archaeon]
VEALAGASVGIAAGCAALAILVAWKGARHVAAHALVLMLAGFGAVQLVRAWRFEVGDGWTDATAVRVAEVEGALRVLASLAVYVFVLAYPTGFASRWRRNLALWLGVVAAYLVAAQFGLPSWTDVTGAIWLGFHSGTDVLAVALFGWAWLREPAGPWRRQFLYVLLAVFLWSVNDAVHDLAALVHLWGAMQVVVAVLSTAALAGALVVVGTALARALRTHGAARKEDLALVGGIVIAFALSPVQFVLDHILVDALALPLFAYAVLKYRLVGVDLHVKRGIRVGVLGAFAVLVVLVVQQAVEQWVGSRFGVAAGALVAGVAIFALEPLRALATRVGERAMPGVQPTDAYFHYRRLQIYRVALEGALREGSADTGSALSLRALREELGITDDEHALVRADAERAARGLPPRA